MKLSQDKESTIPPYAYVATWLALCGWTADTPRSAVLRLEKKAPCLWYLLNQTTGPPGSEDEQVHSQVDPGRSTTVSAENHQGASDPAKAVSPKVGRPGNAEKTQNEGPLSREGGHS